MLRPGRVIGICSPDWGGFILSPPSEPLSAALRAYEQLQRSNGGDPLAGRRLSTHLAAASFETIRTDARYERYLSTENIAHYLATQLEDAGQDQHAATLRTWGASRRHVRPKLGQRHRRSHTLMSEPDRPTYA